MDKLNRKGEALTLVIFVMFAVMVFGLIRGCDIDSGQKSGKLPRAGDTVITQQFEGICIGHNFFTSTFNVRLPDGSEVKMAASEVVEIKRATP